MKASSLVFFILLLFLDLDFPVWSSLLVDRLFSVAFLLSVEASHYSGQDYVLMGWSCPFSPVGLSRNFPVAQVCYGPHLLQEPGQGCTSGAEFLGVVGRPGAGSSAWLCTVTRQPLFVM